MSPARHVLVVRFGSLGDVILTTPLLRALHGAWEGAAITVVTKQAFAPVLAHHPHVRAVVSLEPGMGVAALANRLRATPWDLRLDLHGTPRSRALRLLVGGRWRGYRKRRLNHALRLRLGVGRRRTAVPVAERYFQAVADLGLRPDGAGCAVYPGPDDDAIARAVCDGAPAVLAPGAAHATKRWPPERWRTLTGRFREAGFPVVGVGLPAERAALDGTDAIDGFGIALGATAALMQRARVVVANDSGLMHLATAVGAPVVALFGPTVPGFGFSPYRARATVVERDLPCRPCSAFGGPHCPLGHHRCMFEIDPADVVTAADRLAAVA